MDEVKTCPRCNEFFKCNSKDILRCQCNSIKLTGADREFIISQYIGRLCGKCLRQIIEKQNLQNSQPDL